MKINKYKKLKDNRYEVTLDQDYKIILYDDIIIKYELLLKKEITEPELNKITSDNDSLNAYYLALKYLTKKMRSKKEIKSYLEKKDYNEDIIKLTIDKLVQNKILNDLEFTKCYINDQKNLTLNGPFKIKKNLIDLGIREEDILEYLDFDDQIFKENALKLINKKIKANHKLGNNRLKEKIMGDLYNAGYDNRFYDLIKINSDDSLLLEKAYQKLLSKYQDKENSEYIIKQKLYQQGFSSESINEIYGK